MSPRPSRTLRRRCKRCRKTLPDGELGERCAPCQARAERREAERAERTAARKAEADRRRDARLRREAERARKREYADALTYRSMFDVAAREKEKGSRIAVHCGGYVAYDGRVFTSAEWLAREREEAARRALPAHERDDSASRNK
jgi:FKBP-type peptidyl-prolyl cis-trans isomerase